jgi:hypothetical protein
MYTKMSAKSTLPMITRMLQQEGAPAIESPCFCVFEKSSQVLQNPSMMQRWGKSAINQCHLTLPMAR